MSFQRKQFAVIGLGRFGRSVSRTLLKQGHEVLAIDVSEEETRSAQVEDIATHVIQADTTDRRALEEVSIQDFDTVVVAIGTNLEASVMILLNLLDLGVKRIVAKASSERYGQVLQRLGGEAIRVVYPELQMGVRVANAIGGTDILETIALDPDYSIVEVMAPPEAVGKTVGQADLRGRHGVTVIAIKSGDQVNLAPLNEDPIHPGDLLTLMGSNDRLRALMR